MNVRKAINLGVLTALVFSVAAITVTAQPLQQAISFAAEDVILSTITGEDGAVYDLAEVTFDGDLCSLEGDAGSPALPVCNVQILLPEGDRAVSLEASVGQELALDGAFTIYPQQPPHIISQEPPPFVPPDPAVYASTAAMPETVAELMDTIVVRGHHVALVQVHPLTYVPATGRLSLRADIRLTLNLGRKVGALSYSSVDGAFAQFVAGNVVNPEAMPATRTLGSPVDPDDVKYLLITSASLIDDFQPLLDWKIKKGVPAEAVSTDWIYTNYAGSTNQRKIKECIKDYVQTKGTVWVALGGDSTIVPDRDCYGAVSSYTDATIPTDLYYAGLDDMNWNDDGDSRPCETSGDSIDMGPDVFVGRIPVRTGSDVAAIVNKTLQYEKAIPSSNFAQRLLLAGTQLWNYGDAEGKSENMWNNYMDPYWDGTRYRFYDTATDFSGGSSYDLNISNLQTQYENGYNHMHMATHGNTQIWGMETGSNYDSYDALAIDNVNNEFVNVVTIACITNAFDYSTDPCLGEGFIRNAGGGAVTYIGGARYGWGISNSTTQHGASFQYNRQYYRYLFTGEPSGYAQQVGAVYSAAKEYWASSSTSYGTERWVQFSLNLDGDPELPLYTENPSSFNPSYAGTINTGSQSFTVNTGVPYARVCLSKGSDVYVYGTANSSGQYQATINPATTGTLDVTITRPNYYPHEGTVTVTGGGPTPTPTTPPPTPTPDPDLVFFDDFETSQGWTLDPYGTDTATTGMWERADPEPVEYSGVTMQLGDAYSGSYDLVTGAAAGSSAGSYDIDGGVTSVRSPAIALAAGQSYALSFRYYLSHYSNGSTDDFLRVKVVGNTTQTVFEELGSGDTDSAVWALEEVDVSGFAGQTVRILIEAADAGSGSLVEAGIDDVRVSRTGVVPTDTPPPPPTDTPPPPPTDTPPPPPTATPGPDVFFDDFETSQGWTLDPYGTDTATTGMWERADPEGVEYSGVIMQLENAYSGSHDLVTGAAAGSSAGSYDVDGGVTSVRSPAISLGSGEITLSFRYYLAHYSNGSSDDFLRVKVVGDTTETVFEELGAANTDGAVWDLAQVDVSGFAGQTVRILIEAADAGSGSLIEAGIDDVRVTGQSGPEPTGTPPPPTETPPPGGFSDDFEMDQGWVLDPNGTDTATTGVFERANPEGTEYSGTAYQLGTAASGSYDLVTGALAGSGVGSYDIDGGVTSVGSPAFTVPGGATLSFSYYFAHYSNSGSDDYLRVKVVGDTTETVFEELGSGDVDGAVWESFEADLSGFAGQQVTLLIEAADGGSGSLVEAAVDDVVVQ